MCKFDRDFWRNTWVRHTDITVGTTPTQILKNDPLRVAFFVSNLTANALCISPDPAVTATNGSRISPVGPPTEFTLWQHGAFVSIELWAVFATAGAVVEIIEILQIPSAEKLQ